MSIVGAFYRRRFPAVVNCWFCNENTKISYDDLNQWTCSKCEQYNGFSEVRFHQFTNSFPSFIRSVAIKTFSFFCDIRMVTTTVIFLHNGV